MASLAASLAAAACSHGPPESGAGSPALRPVETWTEDRGPEGFAVVFRNNRRDQIEITRIQIFDCLNTIPDCGNIDPKVSLGPGQVRDIMMVRPLNRQQAWYFHYRYWYSWNNATIAGGPGARSDDAPGLAALAQPFPGRHIATLRVEPDSLVMRVGDTLDIGSLKVLAIDSAGAVIGEVAYWTRIMSPGAAFLLDQRKVVGLEHGVGILTISVPVVVRRGQPVPVAPHVRMRVVVR